MEEARKKLELYPHPRVGFMLTHGLNNVKYYTDQYTSTGIKNGSNPLNFFPTTYIKLHQKLISSMIKFNRGGISQYGNHLTQILFPYLMLTVTQQNSSPTMANSPWKKSPLTPTNKYIPSTPNPKTSSIYTNK